MVDFTNHTDKLRDDSKYLNNEPNITGQSKSVTDSLDAKTRLKEIKIRSSNKLSSGHVNINSIRNKFDSLIYVLDKNGDIFLISETKQDDSFPLAQFKIEGFTTRCRYDRNDKGGSLLLYIRESISVEINLRKRK